MNSDLPHIPPMLDEVTIPRYFGPSSFAGLLQCPLSVINRVSEEKRLLPYPTALLGSLIHGLVENSEVTPDMSLQAIRAMMDEAIIEEEAKLAEDPRLSRFGRLRTIVGRLEYQRQREQAVSWIRERLENSSVVDRATTDHKPLHAADAPDNPGSVSGNSAVPLGAERILKSDGLRISGKVDHLRRDDQGVYHVTDYKTGRIAGADGQVKPAYIQQLGLYALVIKTIDPNAEVRLWLKGERTMEVPFDEDGEEELRTRLEEISQKLPQETTVAAREVAYVGSACTFCRVRHRCPSYREEAPNLWKSKSADSRVAPYDIWGRVESVAVSGGRQTVRLTDAADRSVRIIGLPTTKPILGSEVMYFSLESSARTPMNGIYSHPRSFHAESPSIAWRSADRFEQFIGTD